MGKPSEDPLVNNDPWQLAANQAKPKTLGDFMSPLGAINNPAADAKTCIRVCAALV